MNLELYKATEGRDGGTTRVDFNIYMDELIEMTGGWFKDYEIKAIIISWYILVTKDWLNNRDARLPLLGHTKVVDEEKKGKYFYKEKKYDPEYIRTVKRIKSYTSLMSADIVFKQKIEALERKLHVAMRLVDKYSKTRMKFVKSLQTRKKCPQSL